MEGGPFSHLTSPSLIPINEVKELIKEPTLFVSETLEKWEKEFEELFEKNLLNPLFLQC